MTDRQDDKSTTEVLKDIATLKRVYEELVKEFDENLQKFKDHVNLIPEVDDEVRPSMLRDLHSRVGELADIQRNVQELEDMLPPKEPEIEMSDSAKKSLNIGRSRGSRDRDW